MSRRTANPIQASRRAAQSSTRPVARLSRSPQGGMSRRQFLRTAGIGAAAVGMAAYGMGATAHAELPPTPMPVYYIGADRQTFGAWYDQVPGDKYGTCAWILGAMNATPIRRELPVPVGYDYRFYDVYGGPLMYDGCGVDYKVYTCKGAVQCDDRAPQYPDPTGVMKRRPTCWWSSGTMTTSIHLPPGVYELAIYVLDWDSTLRAETVDVSVNGTADDWQASSFHDGKYGVFEVSGTDPTGSPIQVDINITKTGGSNSVVTGIFINLISPQAIDDHVLFLHEDSGTKGNWEGTYGNDFWMICAGYAMDPFPGNSQPEDTQYDAVGGTLQNQVTYDLVNNGNYWAWGTYCTVSQGGCNVLEPGTKASSFAWSWGLDNTPYGLKIPPRSCVEWDPTNPNLCKKWGDWTGDSGVVYPVPMPVHLSSAASWASCYDDGGENYPTGPDMYVELTLPPAGVCNANGCYHVHFYATDYDSTCRKQAIEIYDPVTGQKLAASHDPAVDPEYGLVGKGVYHSFWMPAGTYLVKVDYYGCTNAILSGIFIDCIDCPGGSGDFRTIGFWKHQFAVATGNNNGRQHVSTSDLESYLLEIGGKTSLPALQGLDLNGAYNILNLGYAEMCDRALQQTLALWLNLASGAVTWDEWVYDVYEGADRPFNQIIADIESEILSGDRALCEMAKTTADFLNNSGYE